MNGGIKYVIVSFPFDFNSGYMEYERAADVDRLVM